MADLSARAERVRAIVETHGGKVLRHIGGIIRVERAADVAQTSPCCGDGTASFRYFLCSGIPVRDRLPRVQCLRCRLAPHDAGVPAPSVAAITMPTPPFKG
jgi:hypothetical protein